MWLSLCASCHSLGVEVVQGSLWDSSFQKVWDSVLA